MKVFGESSWHALFIAVGLLIASLVTGCAPKGSQKRTAPNPWIEEPAPPVMHGPAAESAVEDEDPTNAVPPVDGTSEAFEEPTDEELMAPDLEIELDEPDEPDETPVDRDEGENLLPEEPRPPELPNEPDELDPAF